MNKFIENIFGNIGRFSKKIRLVLSANDFVVLNIKLYFVKTINKVINVYSQRYI